MQCPQCQHENPDGSRFCNACGVKLELTCSACHHVNPAGSRFCNACGNNLLTPIPPVVQPERQGTPEPEPLSYTPQHLANKILTSRSALEGERKQVTVLFADIKDSTELIRDLDPEEAQKLLDPSPIHLMMEAVHRFEGTVNQVLGDGIMWRESGADDQLWREIQAQGYRHSARTVTRFITELRRASEAGRPPELEQSPYTRPQGPSARAASFLVVSRPEKRSRLAQLYLERLFGAPIAHEDHALRACYAALAMQAAMQDYTEEVRRSRGLGRTLRSRVGLNTGEVVVRTITSDLYMEYSAVGQTTNLASRMEQLADPGHIILTTSTLRLVEGLVQVKALGPVPVKSMTEPVEVYELTGASSIRRRLQAAVARGLTKFVGRSPEIDVLNQALEQAGARHGQIVAAVGEAGVGKSRLLYEFIHSYRTQGWRVLESASVSYGKATPYFPIVDLLRRYVHIEDGDDARTIRAKVTGHILTLDETLQETIPALLFLLDVLPEDSQFLQLEPHQRRQQTLDALKRILLRESQVQPLVLAFEDLHWIDLETQALLDSLVESLSRTQLLLLVNYRPEYQHSWASKTLYTQLRLDPLPPESAEALLKALLGDDSSLEPLKKLLIERTEGNPFFLEESVRTLVETQVLAGEPGTYCLAQDLPAIQVPPTVQAVLAARIDRLPQDEKSLLQTASVIGNEVPFTLLQAIAEIPDEALHPCLTQLQAAEFLYETNLFSGAGLYFQACPDARGGLQQPPAGAAARAARAPGRGPRGAGARAGGRAGRTPGAPCRAGRGLGQSRDLLPAGRRQGLRPRRVPRGGGRLRPSPPGPSPTCRSTVIPGGWPSTSASLWETRCSYWESMGGALPCWARPRPWPGRSTTGPGWDECWPGWSECSG